MSKLPRTVISGLPHHVTQRSNGRAQTFFVSVTAPAHSIDGGVKRQWRLGLPEGADRYHFADFIGGKAKNPAPLDRLRRAETIGRPLGDEAVHRPPGKTHATNSASGKVRIKTEAVNGGRRQGFV
jgi:hypothetical protein